MQAEPGAFNLQVQNQHGVDMFGDSPLDNAKATKPYGASDGTLQTLGIGLAWLFGLAWLGLAWLFGLAWLGLMLK